MSDQLCCPICMELYKDPKTLPCGHSFCLACLNKMCHQHSVHCPQCRQTTTIPEGGLATNFVLKGLVEETKTKASEKLPKCHCCEKIIHSNEPWHCTLCGGDTITEICSTCVIEHHNGHEVQKSSVVKEKKRNDTIAQAQAFRAELKTALTSRDQSDEIAQCAENLDDLYSRLLAGTNKFIDQTKERESPPESNFVQLTEVLRMAKYRMEMARKDLITQTYEVIGSLMQNSSDEMLQNYNEKAQEVEKTTMAFKNEVSVGTELEKELENSNSSASENSSSCWKCNSEKCKGSSCHLGAPVLQKIYMTDEMTNDAFRSAICDMKTLQSPQDIAEKLSMHFDIAYGKHWHCICYADDTNLHIGVTAKADHFIEFKLGKVKIILFKSKQDTGCWKCGVTWCNRSCTVSKPELASSMMTANGSIFLFRPTGLNEAMKSNVKNYVHEALNKNRDPFDAAKDVQHCMEQKYSGKWQCLVLGGENNSWGYAIRAIAERMRSTSLGKIEMTIHLKVAHVFVVLFKT